MNAQISDVYRRLALDMSIWRVDEDCTTRVGMASVWDLYGYKSVLVHVSDMRQGHGQNVPIKDAEKLRVCIISEREIVEREDVDVADLYDTIKSSLVEVRV